MAGSVRRKHAQAPAATVRNHITADLDGAIAAPSPARALQLQFEAQAGLSFDARWSARRRLAFIVASASGLWLAVLSAGAGVMHAIA